MSYLFDDILAKHFEKTALLGLLARGAARVAPTAAKAGVGYATGMPFGTAGTVGAAAGALQGLNVSGKRASLREKAEYRFKTASFTHQLAHAAPYAGFIAAHGLDDSGHKNLATVLNLASLGALGVQTGAKETPDKMDLAGLGLMSVAELARLKNRLSGSSNP